MKFLLTKELGRLSTWLRILGFDALYLREANPGSLMIEALRQERTIITRNHKLAATRGVKIVLLEKEKIREQLAEAIKKLRIVPRKDKMFTRCIICNQELAPINKESVKHKVPEYVFKTQNIFFACRKCQRVYWQGTHWGNVANVLEEMGICL